MPIEMEHRDMAPTVLTARLPYRCMSGRPEELVSARGPVACESLRKAGNEREKSRALGGRDSALASLRVGLAEAEPVISKLI